MRSAIFGNFQKWKRQTASQVDDGVSVELGKSDRTDSIKDEEGKVNLSLNEERITSSKGRVQCEDSTDRMRPGAIGFSENVRVDDGKTKLLN